VNIKKITKFEATREDCIRELGFFMMDLAEAQADGDLLYGYDPLRDIQAAVLKVARANIINSFPAPKNPKEN